MTEYEIEKDLGKSKDMKILGKKEYINENRKRLTNSKDRKMIDMKEQITLEYASSHPPEKKVKIFIMFGHYRER